MALSLQSLTIETKRKRQILKNVSFELNVGEVIGVTGESGVGKTVMIKAILGMLERELCLRGDVVIDGESIGTWNSRTHRAQCGSLIGFVPQLPMTAFDPRLEIGKQLMETYRYKLNLSNKESLALVQKTLTQVNLKEPKSVLASRPFELSGGMLQRVAISFLLGLSPKYILADEPTAALDVVNRERVLQLLIDFRKDSGTLFVSHDFQALNMLCDKILVLTSGGYEWYDNFSDMCAYPKGEWTQKFVQINSRKGEMAFTWKDL